ncbi:hypothetical protein DF185_19770 [Marinifilum breve]|uniref:HTH luxR-type domain-containing protein n=1 Tax=Marinifilum breve TaxID=2184082 RepID=A0A2V4A681_9BACT|nr:LuxR C-terminal-related transcriptional regulator [Marinifilum breve]PXX96880.1 hypothetical protein DF185_19770 [Marinifilum breve]
MPHTKLPAGIEDKNLEIYRYGKEVNAVYDGKKGSYLDLPMEMREPFQAEYIADKAAQHCIVNDFGIELADAQEEKFVGCRYGNWDKTPDLANGITTHDAPNCSEEKHCKGFNVLCKIPEAPNGKITKQEYFIIRLVGNGKLDKEIALDLNIRIPTVRTHLNHIREKLQVNNRIEIALWAQSKGIV